MRWTTTVSRSRAGGVSRVGAGRRAGDPRHPATRAAARRQSRTTAVARRVAAGSSPAPAGSDADGPAAKPEMPRAGLEQSRRLDPVATITTARGCCRRRCRHLGVFARERHLCRRRMRSKSPAPRRRGRAARGRRRAVRIQRRAVAPATPPTRPRSPSRCDRARVQQRRVDARGAPRFLLALDPRRPARASPRSVRRRGSRKHFTSSRRSERGEVERGPTPALPRARRGAEPERLLDSAKRRPDRR